MWLVKLKHFCQSPLKGLFIVYWWNTILKIPKHMFHKFLKSFNHQLVNLKRKHFFKQVIQKKTQIKMWKKLLNRISSINYTKTLSGICRKCLSFTNHLFFLYINVHIYIYIYISVKYLSKLMNKFKIKNKKICLTFKI